MSYEGASNLVVVTLAGVLVVVALLTGVSLGFLCARRGASSPLLPITTTKKRRDRADWSSTDPTMLEILDSLHSLRDTFDREQQQQVQQQRRWASSRRRASVRRNSEGDDETSSEEEEETDWGQKQSRRHSGRYQQRRGNDDGEEEGGRRRVVAPLPMATTTSRHAPSSSLLGSRVQQPIPAVPQRRVLASGFTGRNNGSAARRPRLPV